MGIFEAYNEAWECMLGGRNVTATVVGSDNERRTVVGAGLWQGLLHLTSVDFPWATCPITPTFMVA